MEKERLLHLADVIENTPHKDLDPRWSGSGDGPLHYFNMSFYNCGTLGCIKGWGDAIAREAMGLGPDEKAFGETFFIYYGLSPDMTQALYFPETHSSYYGITPAEAAKVIRHLVETGKVDWSIIEGD